MKNWKVPVKVSKTGYTKSGAIPEDLKADGLRVKDKAAFVDMRFPIPDDPRTATGFDWENVLKKFKGWGKDGYPQKAPSLAAIIEAGVKTLLRTEGARIINEAVKEHVAGTEEAKESSGGMEVEDK